MSELIIIDGMSLVFRAYHALSSAKLKATNGEDTSAIYGFCNIILSLLEKEKPDYIAVAFDSRATTFRKELYPLYKANREAFPEDLAPQLERIKQLLDVLNIFRIEYPGYEADDIIGTIGELAKKSEFKVKCLTSDKDYFQLVCDTFTILRPKRDIGDLEIIDRDKVIEKFGTPPEYVVDALALIGDASDNIPGAQGIGEKTAPDIINKFGTIEEIYQNIDSIEKTSIKNKLIASKENVFLSKILAKIKLDIYDSFDFEQTKLKNPNDSVMNELFSLLGLNQIKVKYKRFLQNKFGLEYQIEELSDEVAPKLQTIKDINPDYKIACSLEELSAMKEDLLKSDIISFDLETTSLDTLNCDIVGVSLSNKENTAYYIPIAQNAEPIKEQSGLFDFSENTIEKTNYPTIEKVAEYLKPILENEAIKKCGQNSKFDALILKRFNIETKPLYFDSMLAGFLINPDERKGMDALSAKYLNYEPIPISELIGEKKKEQISMREVELSKIAQYAAEDADVTLKLYNKLRDILEKDNLLNAAETIEFPLIEVLTDMEFTGVFIDAKSLEELSIELGKKIEEIKGRIFEESGETFNIDSPKQLGTVLFDKMKIPTTQKGKTGYSTDVSTLSELAPIFPIAEMVLEYRQMAKLKSTYLDALPLLINKKTKRVHTTYNQCGASTGRLSSSEPNLQNIPIRTDLGKEIRKAFIPEKEGMKIISADYSQIELRIMAFLANDKNLIEAFKSNEDVHTATAGILFNVDKEFVDSNMRRTAKTVNFGVMYGLGAFGLAERLKISRGEAQKIIDNYFEKYKGIKDYIDRTIKETKERGYAETIGGRRKYFANINAQNKNLRSAEERAAINYPIQGSSADMIKIAMIKIYNEIRSRNLKTKMIMQVHDELVFEAPESEIEEMTLLIKEKMESAMNLGEIPLIAEIGIGNNWLEAH